MMGRLGNPRGVIPVLTGGSCLTFFFFFGWPVAEAEAVVGVDSLAVLRSVSELELGDIESGDSVTGDFSILEGRLLLGMSEGSAGTGGTMWKAAVTEGEEGQREDEARLAKDNIFESREEELLSVLVHADFGRSTMAECPPTLLPFAGVMGR